MDQFQKKEALLLGVSFIVFVCASALIYFSINPLQLRLKKTTGKADTTASAAQSHLTDSSSARDSGPLVPQTIIIENVKNNEQLTDILEIIETSTIDREVRDLKIKSIKMEDTARSESSAEEDK